METEWIDPIRALAWWTQTLPNGEIVGDIATLVHLVALSVAIATVLELDWRIMRSTCRALTVHDTSAFNRGHRRILGALAALWASGAVLAWIATGGDPSAASPQARRQGSDGGAADRDRTRDGPLRGPDHRGPHGRTATRAQARDEASARNPWRALRRRVGHRPGHRGEREPRVGARCSARWRRRSNAHGRSRARLGAGTCDAHAVATRPMRRFPDAREMNAPARSSLRSHTTRIGDDRTRTHRHSPTTLGCRRAHRLRHRNRSSQAGVRHQRLA